jgi:hypothetical protein
VLPHWHPPVDWRVHQQPDGAVQAQFVVPVESYTAPIGKLFVTIEPSDLAATPTGPTVMTSV